MKLTPAERRALEALGQHGSVKSAAHALGKSPRTVEQQVRSARDRLGVDTAMQAVVQMIRTDMRE